MRRLLRPHTPEITITLKIILARGEESLNQDEITEISKSLSGADVIAFSSMSGYAPLVKEIIADVRRHTPNAYIVWGGIHPIMDPDDAIQYANAVCTGEGEYAFEIFLNAFAEGRNPSTTLGFWFNPPGGYDGKDKVVINENLPLMTEEEMERLPFPLHQQGETLYKSGQGFRPMTPSDYIEFNGISYPAIWSIGCPFKCTFCGNSKFIDYDKGYRSIRHPSPDYMIREIKAALTKHPFISEIIFHDDSFMALKHSVLEEFATKFRDEIDLPFYVAGVIPNYVDEEKIKILLAGGMNRLRMGVQTGSERMMEFYKRPTPPEKVRDAVQSIGKYSPYMVAPAYDMILDNPMEKREDILSTLDLVHKIPRPFTLNLFSLRIIPGSELEKSFRELGVSAERLSSNYWKHAPTFANCLIYILILFPVPNRLYSYLRKFVLPSTEPQRQHYILMIIVRTLYLVKRAGHHIYRMDFTNLPGKLSYLFWRTGIISWRRRHILRMPRLSEKPSKC